MNKRAIKHILTISLLLNPLLYQSAHATGPGNIIDKEAGYLARKLERAAAREAAEKAASGAVSGQSAAEKATQKTLSEIINFKDKLLDKTNGLMSDIGERVRGKYFVNVFGRTDETRKFIQQIGSMNNNIIVLQGDSRVGKTYIALAAQEQALELKVSTRLENMNTLELDLAHQTALDPEVFAKVLESTYEEQISAANPGSTIVLLMKGIEKYAFTEKTEDKQKLDMFINIAMRTFKNHRLKVVLEGTEAEVKALKKSRFVSQAVIIEVKELSDTETFNAAKEMASRLEKETTYKFSDDSLKTLVGWIKRFMPGVGGPSGLMKVLPQIATYKDDIYFLEHSPLSEILRKKLQDQEAQLTKISMIEAQAEREGRPVGQFAIEREAQLTGEDGVIANTKKRIAEMDENFNKVKAAFETRKRLSLQLKKAGKLSPSEQAKLDKANSEVRTVHREEMVIAIHQESKKQFDEILAINVARNSAERAKLLRSRYFGQPDLTELAIEVGEAFSNPIRLKRAGALKFVLVIGGPGIGKTYLGEEISRIYLGKEPFTYNIGGMKSIEDINAFKGAPIGYVGSNEGSLWVTDLLKEPENVSILDEIVRGKKELLDFFLNPVQSGEVRDTLGRTASLRSTVLWGTGNVLEHLPFGTPEPILKQELVKEGFSNAILTRMRVVQGLPLGDEVFSDLIKKRLDETNAELEVTLRSVEMTSKAQKKLLDELLLLKDQVGPDGKEVVINGRDADRITDKYVLDRVNQIIKQFESRMATIRNSGVVEDAEKVAHEIDFREGDTLAMDYSEETGFTFTIKVK